MEKAEKKKLIEIPVNSYFRTNKHGQIMKATSVIMDCKVCCKNPFGQDIYIPMETLVIPERREETYAM